MPSYSGSVPAPIISTNATPSAADFKFWIKPSTGEAFFSDNTNWTEIPTGSASNSILSIENALNILEIQAADTITPDTSAQIVRDVFTDATGYLNTIDTGNTTATLINGSYLNATEVTDSQNATGFNDASISTKRGMKILTKNACKLTKISKLSTCNASTAYLLDASGSTLASAAFSGDDASFNYDLSDATNYFVALDSGGSNYTARDNESSAGYPFVGTNVNFVANLYYSPGLTSNTAFVTSIESITTFGGNSPAVDKIVQTNKQDLPSTPTKFIVFAFRETTTGTGIIKADVSFDNGSNYQTDISLNTETTITNTGTEMILKLNLDAGASGGISGCEGYGVLFW